MDVQLYYDPLFLRHETGDHPEHAGRLEGIVAQLRASGFWERLERPEFAAAPREALHAVHESGYVRLLEAACARGGGALTADTPFGRESFAAAALACGAAMAAVDSAFNFPGTAGFALVRPPGHHARPAEGMGFCLLNHAAVAARHAIRTLGLRRILLIDYDVHHGNGTQEIFYHDPAVLYFSAHQYPAYPGTGGLREIGAGEGVGATVNVPLPAGTGDRGYARVMEAVLAPVAREFRPELIVVSAGYDAHWTNRRYLSSIRMGVTVSGFAAWVALIRDLAAELCRGRLAFTLEGGYDVEALAWSVEATLRVLREEEADDPLGPPPWAGEPDLSALLRECRRIHGLDGD